MSDREEEELPSHSLPGCAPIHLESHDEQIDEMRSSGVGDQFDHLILTEPRKGPPVSSPE